MKFACLPSEDELVTVKADVNILLCDIEQLKCCNNSASIGGLAEIGSIMIEYYFSSVRCEPAKRATPTSTYASERFSEQTSEVSPRALPLVPALPATFPEPFLPGIELWVFPSPFSFPSAVE
jgi:hypothetical protein